MGILRLLIGGNVWESNPPGVGLARDNGFEARERHQFPVHSHSKLVTSHLKSP